MFGFLLANSNLCFSQEVENKKPLTPLVYRNIKWNKFLSSAPKKYTWKEYLVDRFDPVALKGLIDNTGFNPFDSISEIKEFVLLDEINEELEFLHYAKGKFETDKFNNNLGRVLRNFFKINNFQEGTHKGKKFFAIKSFPIKGRVNYIFIQDPSTLVLTTHKNSIINMIDNQFDEIKNLIGEESKEKNDILFISGQTANFPLFGRNLLFGYFDLTTIEKMDLDAKRNGNDNDPNEFLEMERSMSFNMLAELFTKPLFDFVKTKSRNPKIGSKENNCILRLNVPTSGNGVLLNVQFETNGLNNNDRENLIDSISELKTSPDVFNSMQKFLFFLGAIDMFNVSKQFFLKKQPLSPLTGKKILKIEDFVGPEDSDFKRLENFIENPTFTVEQKKDTILLNVLRPWKKGFLDKILDK